LFQEITKNTSDLIATCAQASFAKLRAKWSRAAPQICRKQNDHQCIILL